MFAEALAARLQWEPDIRVLDCGTGSAALRRALSRSWANVVLGDVALFEPDLIAHDGGPRRPALVLLADRHDHWRLAAAIRSGVRGWVLRDSTVGDLLVTIRAAAEGGNRIEPTVRRDGH